MSSNESSALFNNIKFTSHQCKFDMLDIHIGLCSFVTPLQTFSNNFLNKQEV